MKDDYEEILQQKDEILESSMNGVSNNEKIVETLEQLCKDAKKPQIQRKSKFAQLMAEMFETQKNLQKSFDEIQ